MWSAGRQIAHCNIVQTNPRPRWAGEPHLFFADPDPAVFLNTDPDPGGKINTDPCGSESSLTN